METRFTATNGKSFRTNNAANSIVNSGNLKPAFKKAGFFNYLKKTLAVKYPIGDLLTASSAIEKKKYSY